MSEQIVIEGDCRSVLPSVSKDAIIVTDPPFNVGYDYAEYKDKVSETDYYDLLADIFNERDFVVIHYPEAIHRLSVRLERIPERVVSWVYNSNTPRQHRDIAFYGVKPDFTKYGRPYKNPTDKRIQKRMQEGKKAKLYDWWEVDQVKNVSEEKTEHPCQMPLEVMKRILAVLPDSRQVVDPFCGSGTTLVAAKHLNRGAVGIELSHEYVEIARKRLSQQQLF